MLDKFKLKVRMKLNALLTWKVKTGLVILTLVLVSIGFYKVNQFFQKHEFVFESPISVHLQTPVYLIDRALAQNIIVTKAAVDNNTSPLNETQQYICNKFGKDCKTALAIAKAESNFNCNALNINTNGTIDFGIFQLNSIHMKKGWSLADMGDCKKNTDLAFELYQKQGFTPWVAYTTGAYKKYLIN